MAKVFEPTLVQHDPNTTQAAAHLTAVSNQLDETIKDVEDFLVGLHFGVEAAVRLREERDDEGSLEEFVGFRRGKKGWRLTYEIAVEHVSVAGADRRVIPLVEASRGRKVFALRHLQALLAELRSEAAMQANDIQAVISDVKRVIAEERGKS